MFGLRTIRHFCLSRWLPHSSCDLPVGASRRSRRSNAMFSKLFLYRCRIDHRHIAVYYRALQENSGTNWRNSQVASKKEQKNAHRNQSAYERWICVGGIGAKAHWAQPGVSVWSSISESTPSPRAPFLRFPPRALRDPMTEPS